MGRVHEAMVPSPYGNEPGWKEPTTSREAAKAIAADADLIRQRVLAAIEAKPSTSDEIATALDLSILTVRPRCSELRTDGKIRASLDPDGRQKRRRNSSGRNAIVWELGSEESQ